MLATTPSSPVAMPPSRIATKKFTPRWATVQAMYAPKVMKSP